MTTICGLFSPRPAPDHAAVVRHMLAAAAQQPADDAIKQSGGACIGAFGTASEPALIGHDGIVLALVGHPRLRTAHGWSTDPIAIAEAIGAQGTAALSAIGGDFALAAWDGAKSRGLLAIDRIGIRQLVYARSDDGLVFASTLDTLLRHPGVKRELSQQAVFDYLYFHVCPGPQTIYRGLYRIPPAHFVEFGPGMDAQPRSYWSMRFAEDSRHDFASLKDRFVTLVQNAVAAAANGVPCGAFLSGGTDSSTVSGMLGRTTRARARTFSIGFDAAGYDEMNYARIAARHFDCDHHEYYVTPADVVAAAPRIAAHYDQPFGNASAIPAFYCAALARDHGVQRLLAGDGGDELFGGNERYAKQHVLGLYHRLPAGIRALLIEPLVLSTPLIKALPGLRKLHSYVQQAKTDMPQRYESHNLLTHLVPENVLAPEFLVSIDRLHPHELMREAYAPYAGCSLINQMLGIDLRFTLADNDLPKVTRTCELAGIDVAFPLLDESVVDFSAQLPAHMKLRGTRLRWFFKEALRDFLPSEVIAKRKHGFGLPVGAWLTSYAPLRALAREGMDIVRQRRIVDARFVDELDGRLLGQHPAYYGTLIWVLMMLGLWLDSRRL